MGFRGGPPPGRFFVARPKKKGGNKKCAQVPAHHGPAHPCHGGAEDNSRSHPRGFRGEGATGRHGRRIPVVGGSTLPIAIGLAL